MFHINEQFWGIKKVILLISKNKCKKLGKTL
jgi:hypothetical protein